MAKREFYRIDLEELKRRLEDSGQNERFEHYTETYKSYTTPMKMKCKVCGYDFWRKPSAHIFSILGCSNCAGQAKHTRESFIEKATKVHNGKYDYSLVEYKTNKDKVCIICPVAGHGKFFQRPDDHLKGRGCNECNPYRKSNTKEFIEKAKKLHGNTYSYGNVEYVNNSTKVSITCSKHGDFKQSPNGHLLGYGCPKCLYKNETRTGECIKKITGIEAKKKTIQINRGIVKKAIVDFYFEWKGKTIIVEYNGGQHYTPKLWNGKGNYPINMKNRFEKQKLRDQYVREHCEANGILLIEIDGRSYYGNKIMPLLKKKLNEIATADRGLSFYLATSECVTHLEPPASQT